MVKAIKVVTRKIKSLAKFEKPLLVFEAIFYLIASKILLNLFPFKWVTRLMGELVEESFYEKTNGTDDLQIFSEAIKIADRNIPFGTACYVQALAGKLMLRRRDIKSTLYLGVLKNEEGTTKGHAWLSYGDYILTGKKGHQKYQVIAKYN